ncbi:hypothetical protein CFY87_04260 [Actinobacillus seminis]|uniref:Uncharacterized protein n=1 Tax=Actinobacillus seminis TaxID=722 RepID=A0A263HEL0_9PAST|nr:hypothetical protein [Actinobacillus seminis]OZN25349.1 hypothetical protein CFY87_04260 [Actinobacillus seminis]SUU35697.1 Uncharacterised protein [Actinobacillus seminis]
MELIFFLLWVPALILAIGTVVLVVLPLFTVLLTFALPALLVLGFILLLWAITENIMLSILIFCTIVVMNLIYHRESVKEFFANR